MDFFKVIKVRSAFRLLFGLVMVVVLPGATFSPLFVESRSSKAASKPDSPEKVLRTSAGRYRGTASIDSTLDFTATGGAVSTETFLGRSGSIQMPRGKGRGACDLSDIGIPLAGKTKITKAKVRGRKVIFAGRYNVANSSVRASGPIKGHFLSAPEAKAIRFTARLNSTYGEGKLHRKARFQGFKR